jgi:hypothetical protein
MGKKDEHGKRNTAPREQWKCTGQEREPKEEKR